MTKGASPSIPSAVLCKWLREGGALGEVVPILFRMDDLEDTPYGQIAQPMLDHLAYMIECRPWLIAEAAQERSDSDEPNPRGSTQEREG